MSLETAQKVIVPQKKIMSCSFLNSGTLIVKKCDAADMSKDSILCMTGACTTGLFFPNTKLQLPMEECPAQPYTVIFSEAGVSVPEFSRLRA
jgi:hypothetical protein